MLKTIRLLKEFHRLPEEYREIVFFSEGGNYWNTMAPIIESLLGKNRPLVYLTMDNEDPGLLQNSDNVASFCLGRGMGFIYFMSMLRANLVVMTTPGLQTLTIKRSPTVKHYVHVLHSPTGVSFYRKFSFDYFDTVMCSGRHQIAELRELEKIRNSKPKNLMETGLPYMDLLRAQLKNSRKDRQEEGVYILLAPTWGANGALNRYRMRLIDILVSTGFDIIIRPHPQQLKSENSLISKLESASRNIDRISWDFEPSGHKSLLSSNIMISDLSGIIFDYAFVYEKPVITLDYELDIRNFEHEDLEGPIWEREIAKSLGAVVSDDNLDMLPATIMEILARKNLRNEMRELRETSIFNLGHAGEVAANQLIGLLEASP